jgi:hypothetical protein
MIEKFTSFLFILLIFNALNAQEHKNIDANDSDNTPSSTSIIINKNNTKPEHHIQGMDPRRVEDATKMLGELEKQFIKLHLPKENNSISGNEPSISTAMIIRISPHCPLDSEHPDFYSDKMYFWVNEFSLEYINLLDYFVRISSENNKSEE